MHQQQIIYLNQSKKYRKLVYLLFLIFSSFILGVYFFDSYLLYVGFSLVFLSIVYEIYIPSPNLTAIVLPSDKEEYFNLVLDGEESYFWQLKRYIVIRNWVYLKMLQENSNIQHSFWLHKKNFSDKNGIRLLSKTILLRT